MNIHVSVFARREWRREGGRKGAAWNVCRGGLHERAREKTKWRFGRAVDGARSPGAPSERKPPTVGAWGVRGEGYRTGVRPGGLGDKTDGGPGQKLDSTREGCYYSNCRGGFSLREARRRPRAPTRPRTPRPTAGGVRLAVARLTADRVVL